MIALSHSREQDLACPWRFHEKHIAKTVPREEKDFLVIGSDFAKFAERYRKHCKAHGVETDYDFVRDYDVSKLAYPERVAELIEKFSQSDFAVVPIDSKHFTVEARMAFDSGLLPLPEKMYFSKKVAYRGKVDMGYKVGSTVYLVDDKTGWSDADPEQLRKYAYLMPLWRKIRSFDKIVCVLNYVAKGSREVVGEYGRRDVNDVFDEIMANLESVNSRTEWPAVPGDLCHAYGGCPVPSCPERDRATAVGGIRVPWDIASREDAEAVARLLMYQKPMKAKLKEWVEANGGVSVDGYVADFADSKRWKCRDAGKALRALKLLGVDPEIIMGNLSLSEKEIAAICRQGGLGGEETQDFLLQYGAFSDSRRFDLRKEKDESE